MGKKHGVAASPAGNFVTALARELTTSAIIVAGVVDGGIGRPQYLTLCTCVYPR